MVCSRALSEDKREILRSAFALTEELGGMTNDLFDVSRIQECKTTGQAGDVGSDPDGPRRAFGHGGHWCRAGQLTSKARAPWK